MADGQDFIDYYKVLGVSTDCDPKALEAAYRRLAKKYHPDHAATADVDRFNEVTAAYRILRDRDRRADYDSMHAQNVGSESPFSPRGGPNFDESAAVSDADDHARILDFLYKKRRDDAQNPGVVAFYLQEMLDCTHEHFEFHKWYLKEKGFIAITEQGTLAITIQGVDHVIAMSRTARAEKLLLTRPSVPGS